MMLWGINLLNFRRVTNTKESQWLFLVPLKGGRPPIGSIYHLYNTYILPSGGLYATYNLLREPETTVENPKIQKFQVLFCGIPISTTFPCSWEPKVPPPKATPPRNQALIRPY